MHNFGRSQSFVLTLSCVDQSGIVAAISSCIADLGCNIIESQQFNDKARKLFFMRIEFDFPDAQEKQSLLRLKLSELSARFSMQWNLWDRARKKRITIFVSRFDHCLEDLLYRMRIGELVMDVVGIISNHPREKLNITALGDIPYHYLPVTAETKRSQEVEIIRILKESETDLVVLARYMQVFSDDLSSLLAGRCVNIHHSFLPGFKGAKPYHQAHNRGVKMIGATAHFVTPDLDEGPIIAQDVIQVTHADTAEDLVRKGRNVEQRVLSQAVTWLIDERVMLNGDKTVVFA